MATNIPVVNGNVATEYNWTITGKGLPRTQVPTIKLREFQITASGLRASIQFWFSALAGLSESLKGKTPDFNDLSTQGAEVFGAAGEAFVRGEALTPGLTNAANNVIGGLAGAEAAAQSKTRVPDPYEALYVANPTGNCYRLPFYTNYHHDISNVWSENKGPLGETVDNLIVPIAKAFVPSAGIETAKAWEGTNAASYQFSFSLLNTVDPVNDIVQNQTFINALIQANLQDRLNSVMSLPPVIYEIEVPGIRTSPAAVISNLSVNNEGQINNIGGQNIPDSYKINIQVTELITESRQIFNNGGGNTGIINAIVTDDAANAAAQNIGQRNNFSGQPNIGDIVNTA